MMRINQPPQKAHKYSVKLTPWIPSAGNGKKRFYDMRHMGVSTVGPFGTGYLRNQSLMFMRISDINYGYYSDDGGNTVTQAYANGTYWSYSWSGYFVRANGERMVFGQNMQSAGTPSIGIFTSDFATLSTVVASPLESDGTRLRQPLSCYAWDESASGVMMIANYNADTCASSSIWKSTDGGRTWTACLTKRAQANASREIRHWHFVQCDPYTGYWWAGCGDNGAEANIFFSTDDGVTWNTFLTGAATGYNYARAINLVFTQEKIIWGTDDASMSGCLCVYNKVPTPVPITANDLTIIQFPNIIVGTLVTPYGLILLGRVESTMVAGDKNNIYIGLYDWYDQKIYYIEKIPCGTVSNYAGFSWGSQIWPINGKYFVRLDLLNCPVTMTPLYNSTTPTMYTLEVARVNY